MDEERLILTLKNEIFNNIATDKEGEKKDTGFENLEYKQREIDSQLQVARQALNILMRNFSTVRPMLRKVKKLYESALDVRNSRLEEYINLTKSLLGLKDICKDPAFGFHERKNAVLDNLEKERSFFHTTIEMLMNEKEKKEAAIKELEKKLEGYSKQVYREIRSRHFVLSDLNELKKKMVMLENRIKMSAHIQADDNFRSYLMKNIAEKYPKKVMKFTMIKDPLVLQEALNDCQETIVELSTQLCTLKARYAEVVPQKQFEAAEDLLKSLKIEKNGLEEFIVTLKKDNQKLKEANNLIKNENKSLLNKIDDLETGSSIISSQWLRCAKYVPGGITRWKRLSAGKTNGQKLELLAKEFEIMAAASSYYEENVIFT